MIQELPKCLMKYFRKPLLVAGVLGSLLTTKAQAQVPAVINTVTPCPLTGYIEASQPVNSGTTALQKLITDNGGNGYVLQNAKLSKISPSGALLWSRGVNGAAGTFAVTDEGFKFDGGYLYVTGTVPNVSAVPGIVGPTASVASSGTVMLKVDPATGATVAAYAVPGIATVKNGDIYYASVATGNSLASTDGSAFTAPRSLYMGKINSSGTQVYAGYKMPTTVGTTAMATGVIQVSDDGSLYVQMTESVPGGEGSVPVFHTLRLDPSGSLVYNLPGAYRLDDPAGNNVFGFSNYNAFYDTRCGNAFQSNSLKTSGASGQYQKLNASGTPLFSSPYNIGGTVALSVTSGNYSYFFVMLGSTTTVVKMDNTTGTVLWNAQVPESLTGPPYAAMDIDASGNVWLYSQTAGGSYTGTNGSVFKGGNADMALTGYNSSGTLIYSGYIGGNAAESAGYVSVRGGKIYTVTTTVSADFPFTAPVALTGNVAYSVVNFATAPVVTNNLTPASSSVCLSGAGQTLNGNAVNLSGVSGVPALYRNGQAETQTSGIAYQWQSSPDNVTWTDLPGITTQNYLPQGLTATTYFRRTVKQAASCSTVLSTSAAVVVNVNGNNAPTVTAAVPGYTTCPNSPVNITLNIAGGATPYTATWDDPSATLSATSLSGSVASATATPVQNTAYVLKVTDANGCVQYGQAQVMAYSAGPDQVLSKCGSDSVLIGNPPSAAGVSGVSYAWTPVSPAVANFACATCPQTKVLNAGSYLLTQTITKTNTGTCSVSATALVAAIAAPTATAPDGFAGPDITLCSPANSSVNVTGTIGRSTTPGSSFTYTWSPGSYLNNNHAFNTTIALGSVLPVNNPMTYYLTATRSGCTFVDSMKVSVLRADAGIDGCGPRTIGNPVDPIPGISGKTYSWTRLDNGAGAAAFTGATNTRTSTVSSGSIDTRFVLTVSAAGLSSCSDTVVVTAGCVCTNSRIDVLGPTGCPLYSAGGPAIKMQVITPGVPANNIIYSWSPAAGLDRYDSSVVTLTDGVNRTYTVTLTDANTGEMLCTISRETNGIGWSFPTFTALDTTICPPVGTATTTLSLGQSSVVGYSYIWTGTGLSSTTIANPSVTYNSGSTGGRYVVKVTDNVSGCMTADTANVAITSTTVNAGPDLLVCNSATVTLATGIDSLSNYAYAWTPASSWQNGTDSSWLHAQVAVGATTNFTLLATNKTTGCSASDVVAVITNPSTTVTIDGPSLLCKGSSATLKAPVYGNAIYTWTSSNPAETMPAPASGLNAVLVTPTANTTYTLSISYGTGCALTGTKPVSVTDLSYIPASHTNYCPASGTAGLILGPSIAPSSGTAPYTYSWSPANLVTAPTAINTTPSVAPSSNTSYVLTITDATGCSASTTETVNVITGSQPDAGIDRNMCSGNTETLGNASNVSVTWNAVAPATVGLLGGGVNAAAPTFTPVATGTYKFYVQYSTGCVNPDTVTIVVKANPTLTATGATLCSGVGSVATIGATAVAGLSYQWAPLAGLDNPTAAQTLVHADLVTGSQYTLTATDANGCQTTVNVPVNISTTGPQVTVPALSLCQNGTPTMFNTLINGTPAVNGSTQYTAVWTPATLLDAATLLRPTVLPGDTGTFVYNVNIADQTTGCNAQATAQVNVVICSNPLPVKLLRFTAIAGEGRTALLNWSTASETDLMYFAVEGSVDSRQWTKLGTVPSAGDNSSYYFVDEHPVADVMYYRLRSVDLDGSAGFSPIRQVKFAAAGVIADNSIRVYPNPTTGQVSLRTSRTVDQMLLTDVTGRVLKQWKQVEDGSIIELPSQLPAGVYMLKCNYGNDVKSVKLVLNRQQ